MKKILSAVTALSLLSAGFVFAQDYEEYEESSDPVLNISGVAGASGRAWLDKDELKSNSKGADSLMENDAYVNLDLEYIANVSDFSATLKFDAATIKDHPEDIISEFTARGYFADGAVTIEAGKEKLVWGKGDKQHVLDNFNANDYTDFVIPDYIDRRLAEPMVRLAIAPSYMNDYISNIKIEGVWTPMMTADRFATDGMWYPAKQANLTSTVEGIIKGAIDTSDAAHLAPTLMRASQFDANDLYADNIKTLKYGQAGARLGTTFMGIDLAASYYYGHYKQPTADLSQVVTAQGFSQVVTSVTAAMKAQVKAQAIAGGADDTTAEAMADGFIASHTAEISATAKGIMGRYYNDNFNSKYSLPLPSLNYDQVQVFGLEAAFVFPEWLLGLNTRYEFAYNLTEDTTGDNPWVKNNSIGWVAGFDRDLPIHNININFQNVGKLVLGKNKIEGNKNFCSYDTDYNSDGKYTNNKLILNISDKFLHEKLTVECSGVYVVETKGILVMPKVEYTCADGLTLGVNGAYIRSDNENCEFYNFTAGAKDNYKAFVQFTAKYQF